MKVNVTFGLVIFLASTIGVCFSMALDNGKQMPSYTVDYGHPMGFAIISFGYFILGFMHGRDRDE